jgi:hypothetical protein
VQAAIVIAKRRRSQVSQDRVIELANLPQLYVEHWIELVGIGLGRHESYEIRADGITFRRWEDEYLLASPTDWQKEMARDNRTAPQLAFPCTVQELLAFIDAAIGIHCFKVPDDFRLAAASNVQKNDMQSHHIAQIEGSGGAEQQAPQAIIGPPTSLEKQDKKPNKRNRVPPMQALIKRFVDDGINPNIAEFWLHAYSKRGTDDFPVNSVGDSSLTTVEGKSFKKTQIDGALKRYRKAHKSV